MCTRLHARLSAGCDVDTPFPSTPFTTGIVGLVGIDAAGLAFFPARRPSHEGMGLVVFLSGGVLIHGQ